MKLKTILIFMGIMLILTVAIPAIVFSSTVSEVSVVSEISEQSEKSNKSEISEPVVSEDTCIEDSAASIFCD
jgi:hypothetical protein